MKNRVFRISEYEFSNDYKHLIEYLDLKSIDYKIDKEKLTFDLVICGQTLNWTCIVIKNTVTSMFFYCNSTDLKSSEMIQDMIRDNYTLTGIDNTTKVELYSNLIGGEIDYDIIMQTTKVFRVTVEFEDPETSLLLKTKSHKNLIISYIVLSLIGIGLSCLFIYQYMKHDIIALDIITGLLSYFYMLFALNFLSKMHGMAKYVRRVAILVFPIMFVAVVFGVLFLTEYQDIATNEAKLDFLLWAIYAMPGFIPITSAIAIFALGS